jgi:hypothetical protein
MKVKVKHSVELDQDELVRVVTAVVAATKSIYTSEEEEIVAITAILEPELTDAVVKAFALGNKIREAKADITDTTMYS